MSFTNKHTLKLYLKLGFGVLNFLTDRSAQTNSQLYRYTTFILVITLSFLLLTSTTVWSDYTIRGSPAGTISATRMMMPPM